MEKLRSDAHGVTLTKTCSVCKKASAVSEFAKNRSNKDGLRYECRPCMRVQKFKQRYGITLEQWDQMFIDQCGRCLICKVDLPPKGKGVHTDHCHNKGSVRGLLCSHCNLALGHAKDNPNTLRAAAEYIEDYTEVNYMKEKCEKVKIWTECIVCTVGAVIVLTVLAAVIISLGVV